MSPLKQKIIERIKAEGPISFETFMEMALYYPGLGYYMKETANIGRSGDFYTSSHLHPIFGALIGRQMEEMWEVMGMPADFRVVEMGAGMGYLAKDMLEYLKTSEVRSQKSEVKESFFRHLTYVMVERNTTIRTMQQELLTEFRDKVEWVSDLNDLEPTTGCFLSNELLDALPVKAVEMDDELMEIYVSVNETYMPQRDTKNDENYPSPIPLSQGEVVRGRAEVVFSGGDDFIEIKMPANSEIREYLGAYYIELSKSYRTEVNLKLKEWLRDVEERLSEGFILTIDYGYPAWDYYGEDRNRGTLLCYYQHQVNEDPYQNIGEQDLTAHVNFSSLKKWGEDFGLKTIGFCPQGTYLVSLGIDEVITELYGDSPDAFEIAKIKGLILPQGMGESHKVMIQYKGHGEPRLRGFTLRNQAAKL